LWHYKHDSYNNKSGEGSQPLEKNSETGWVGWLSMAQFPIATVNTHNSRWKVVKVTSREKLSGTLCTHTHTHTRVYCEKKTLLSWQNWDKGPNTRLSVCVCVFEKSVRNKEDKHVEIYYI